MVKALQYVHDAGYVYNNLKMENILVSKKKSNHQCEQVKLIDYSLAQEYLDEEGNHLECCKVDSIDETNVFSSLNSLNLNSVSRKDDLISLCYMVFLIINDGQLPFLKDNSQLGDNEVIIGVKKKHSLQEMLASLKIVSEKTNQNLMEFVTLIDNLNFCDCPDYDKLISLIEHGL